MELNPGPKPAHGILSCVCGTFNQGNIKFGFIAGRQCSCTSLVAVCWATVKRVGSWHSNDLDFIVNTGDEIYKDQNTEKYLMAEELPRVQVYGPQNAGRYLSVILSLAKPFMTNIFVCYCSHTYYLPPSSDFSCCKYLTDFFFILQMFYFIGGLQNTG